MAENKLTLDFSEVFGKETVKLKVVGQEVFIFASKEIERAIIEAVYQHHIPTQPRYIDKLSCISLYIEVEKIKAFIDCLTSQLNQKNYSVEVNFEGEK